MVYRARLDISGVTRQLLSTRVQVESRKGWAGKLNWDESAEISCKARSNKLVNKYLPVHYVILPVTVVVFFGHLLLCFLHVCTSNSNISCLFMLFWAGSYFSCLEVGEIPGG